MMQLRGVNHLTAGYYGKEKGRFHLMDYNLLRELLTGYTIVTIGLSNEAQSFSNEDLSWDVAQTCMVEAEPFDDDESTDLPSEVGPTHSEGEALETYDETPASPVHEECDIQFIEVKCI